MKPVPADMLLFFFLKMDVPLITTMLDKKGIYAGMPHTHFISWLEDAFAVHRSLGDELLLTLPGAYDTGKKRAYSLLGNKTSRQLAIAFELNEQDMIVAIHEAGDFAFDENEFVNFNKA
jgi:hypothetical protein